MSAAYFDLPAVNWSTLKLLDDSPLAYKHGLEHKRKPTAALDMGRLVHTLVFEPEQFGAEYAVFPGKRRAGKEWEAFETANAGKTIFKEDELDEARAMADAVRNHQLVKPYLVGGKFETVVTWTDPATGLRCKAKPDWIIPDRRVLIDLKTCRSVERRRFAADVARYGYYGQLGHYAAGCTHGLGWTPERRLLIAVEKTAPHDVAVYELDDAACEIGDEKQQELLAKLKACIDSDTWPGRYSEEQTLELPGWVFGADDLDITFDEEE